MRNTLTPKARLFTFLGAALPVTFLVLSLCPPVVAETGDHERDRMKESGQVMQEILNTNKP
jgi:hypothetical protein